MMNVLIKLTLLAFAVLSVLPDGTGAAELTLIEAGNGYFRCGVTFDADETIPLVIRGGIPFGAGATVRLENPVTVALSAADTVPVPESPIGPVTHSMLRHLQVAGFQLFPCYGGTHPVRLRRAEVVVSYGPGTLQGRIPVTGADRFDAQYRALLVNYEQARTFRTRAVGPPLAKAATPVSFPGTSYRVAVTEDGMYRLDYAYLKARGIDPAAIDPQTVKMYNRHAQIPVRVTGDTDHSFDTGDAVIFYGERYRDGNDDLKLQAPANTYYLTWGGAPGIRMAEDPVPIPWIELLTAPRNGSFGEVLHFEEQNIFERQPELVGSDYYYWIMIGSQYRTSMYLDIPDPAETADSAFISIRLQGITYDNADSTDDHHFMFSLNDAYLGGITWDGRTAVDFVSRPFPSSSIHSGALDTLTILGPKDTPGRVGLADLAYIDWIEVRYRRQYRARNNALSFSGDIEQGSGSRRYHVDGFLTGDIDLYDTDGRILAGFSMVPSDTSGDTVRYRMSFTDDAADPVRYIALDAAGYRQPADLVPNLASSAPFANTAGAEYVIITHRLFSEAAESLKIFRQSGGLSAAVFFVDDIFHYYADGIETPEAIKSFLTDAVAKWDIPPAYVLLLGDATYSSGPHPYDFIPTQLVRTPKWGMTASDNWYAAVSGDDPVPDLMLGRLPARTAAGAMAMYRKTVRHAREAPGMWRRNLALFAGGDETKWSDFDVFVGISEGLAFDPAYRSRKVYTVSRPGLEEYAGGHAEAAAVINAGAPLVNFTGHGGGSVWADKNLLNLGNLPSLTNADRLPLVFSLTCFTGFFDNPNGSSLGEEMLRSTTGGAAGFIGASGFGWREGDRYFNRYLFDAVFGSGLRTFGAVLNAAKFDMHLTVPAWDAQIVEQYTLLGDPAAEIAMPEAAVALNGAAVAPGDTLRMDVSCSVLPGSVYVEVEDPSGTVVANAAVFAPSSPFAYAAVIPAGTDSGTGTVRCYAWNGQHDAIGSTPFSVTIPLLIDRGPVPVAPVHGDSVYIEADVDIRRLDPDSVVCRFKPYGENDWIAVRMAPVSVGAYRYRTVDAFVRPALTAPARGRAVEYQITAYYFYNKSVQTGFKSYMVRSRPDLAVYRGAVGLENRGGVRLYAVIADSGEVEAESVTVRFYAGAPDTGTQLGNGTVAVLVTPATPARVSVPLPDTLSGVLDVHVVIDPDSNVSDGDRSNNIYRKRVEVNLFAVRSTGGSGGIRYSADGVTACVIPDSAVDSQTVANFTALPADSAGFSGTQPDFHPAAVPGGGHPVYSLELLDGSDAFHRPVLLAFRYDTADTDNAVALRERRLAVCRRDPVSERWQRLTGGIDTTGARDTVLADRPGIYALCIINDGGLPDVGVTVEGQDFTDGDYTARQPSIGAVITDRNGVLADSVRLLLNGEVVDPAAYARSAGSGNGGMCLVSYRPRLEPGTHTLQVLARDNALLANAEEITFTVADKFGIRFLANHPNPFWDRTVIAYRLTGMAGEVVLKIYTAGGRLIRTFKRYGVIDYDEVEWDARDSRGRLVANGTYHLQLTAERDGERVTERTVMAFMRR